MEIIGVKFNVGGRTYSFDPKGVVFEKGDVVIVETVKGIESGTVAEPNHNDETAIPENIKPVIRKATQRDLERIERNKTLKGNALKIATEKIEAHGLPMKPVDAEYAFDGSKLVIYFASDNRVDFRDLVKDLASTFHMRIELRQIGIRDECKMLGGLGACGRPCCCATFLPDFARTSVKMAKTQGLSLNPTKISGLCGRLMCCLSYENAHYAETAKKMPKLGAKVETVDGEGTVVSLNMLKEVVRVKFAVKDGFETKDYTIEALLNKTASIADSVEEDDDAEADELGLGLFADEEKVDAPRNERRDGTKPHANKKPHAPEKESKPAPQAAEQQDGEAKPQGGKKKRNRHRNKGKGGHGEAGAPQQNASQKPQGGNQSKPHGNKPHHNKSENGEGKPHKPHHENGEGKPHKPHNGEAKQQNAKPQHNGGNGEAKQQNGSHKNHHRRRHHGHGKPNGGNGAQKPTPPQA